MGSLKAYDVFDAYELLKKRPGRVADLAAARSAEYMRASVGSDTYNSGVHVINATQLPAIAITPAMRDAIVAAMQAKLDDLDSRLRAFGIEIPSDDWEA